MTYQLTIALAAAVLFVVFCLLAVALADPAATSRGLRGSPQVAVTRAGPGVVGIAQPTPWRSTLGDWLAIEADLGQLLDSTQSLLGR